jgi:hypothetical protein
VKRDIFFIVFFFIFNAVFFQNCGSNVQFVSQVDDSNLDTESPDDSGEMPNIPPPGTPPETGVIFDCLKYVEMDQNSFVVPPRDDSGTCYYVKLLRASAEHASGSMGEPRANDVLSSNHDGDFNEYVHPYVLGGKEVHFTLKSPWKIAISSSHSNPKAKMYIDNFFLLEMRGRNYSYKWAYGTADAEPGTGVGSDSGLKKRPILVDNKAIDSFYAFAPGGTAEIQAIGISKYALPEEALSLRFRALDCGSAAVTTTTFLVFH